MKDYYLGSTGNAYWIDGYDSGKPFALPSFDRLIGRYDDHDDGTIALCITDDPDQARAWYDALAQGRDPDAALERAATAT